MVIKKTNSCIEGSGRESSNGNKGGGVVPSSRRDLRETGKGFKNAEEQNALDTLIG